MTHRLAFPAAVWRNRPLWALAAVLGAALLGGCAGTLAYRDAERLAAGDRPDAALSKYREALTADPDNVSYRTGYLLARQKTVAAWLAQAGRAAAEGRLPEAERLYRAVLELDADKLAARDGLAALRREAAQRQTLAEAAEALRAGRTGPARKLVNAVLAQDPKNERARGLLQELDAQAAAAGAEPALSDAYRKKLSIDFRDATLRQVFDVVSRTSGLNILFDKDVKTDQKTTIFLKDNSIEAAIHYLLLTHQLEMLAMDANTILIYPNTAAKLKDYQPLVVRTFQLSNGNARAVAESLKTMLKLRDVVVDDKLNMLIVRDSAEAVRLAAKIVALQDVAEPEVMLEVEILEVSRGRLLELGVAWPGSLSLTPLAGSSGTLTLADLRSLGTSTVGATIDPAKINARAVDTDTNLLANPRIRVLNREKARVLIGNKVPSISTTTIATGLITESVSYFDVGLKLEVEPIVYVNDDVTIKIGLEVSNIVDTQKSDKGTVTYTIGTRSASTSLRLKDGENQILAGLIDDQDRRTANKVPGIGELPVAGRLFGSTLNDGKKTEIVLSITPHLIRNVQRLDAQSAEFGSGTETSLRRRPEGASGADASPAAAADPAPAAVAAPSAPAPATARPAAADIATAVPPGTPPEPAVKFPDVPAPRAAP